jgi:2-polyprenyl-3-methyl-5-hydroxy-6-metoxy-1,4-benzoquinol methylase
MVGTNQTVLDLGCGEGFFASELVKDGNKVTGIDNRVLPAENLVFEQYFAADLDQGMGAAIEELRGTRFNRVLLLDVLEHLRRPQEIVKECHAVLKRDGFLIVSVPNVANIAIRLMLLFGRFNYTERGILDKTHVRFFTRKTARRLLEENGYSIVEEKLTVIPLELILSWSPDNFLLRILNRVLAFTTWMMPGLFGYQIMFRARKTAP